MIDFCLGADDFISDNCSPVNSQPRPTLFSVGCCCCRSPSRHCSVTHPRAYIPLDTGPCSILTVGRVISISPRRIICAIGAMRTQSRVHLREGLLLSVNAISDINLVTVSLYLNNDAVQLIPRITRITSMTIITQLSINSIVGHLNDVEVPHWRN